MSELDWGKVTRVALVLQDKDGGCDVLTVDVPSDNPEAISLTLERERDWWDWDLLAGGAMPAVIPEAAKFRVEFTAQAIEHLMWQRDAPRCAGACQRERERLTALLAEVLDEWTDCGTWSETIGNAKWARIDEIRREAGLK